MADPHDFARAIEHQLEHQQRELQARQLFQEYERSLLGRASSPRIFTIGSARVIDGILRLNFTDSSRIDIPMAVVSEIIATVLSGRLAMGFGEEPSK